MTAQTSAGSTLGIVAAQPATYNQAGYEALTFVTIGEITDHSEQGLKYAEVTTTPVATRAVRKYKGSFNGGNKSITLNLDYDDAGQDIARLALASDNDYSFAEILQDGSAQYFQAKVMSFVTKVGAADNMVMATMDVAITANSAGLIFVEVPA
jgi:hypothetical protein